MSFNDYYFFTDSDESDVEEPVAKKNSSGEKCPSEKSKTPENEGDDSYGEDTDMDSEDEK